MDFEKWIKAVDAHIAAFCGLGSDDLPDCCYRDWYDSGVSPAAAAKRAIKNAKES